MGLHQIMVCGTAVGIVMVHHIMFNDGNAHLHHNWVCGGAVAVVCLVVVLLGCVCILESCTDVREVDDGGDGV
jgi:NADH:ubiquinone oxidoreductase subunit 6 (subunit J)